MIRAIDTTKCSGFTVTSYAIAFYPLGSNEADVVKLNSTLNDEQIIQLAKAIAEHWYDYAVIWLDKLLGDSNAKRTSQNVSSKLSVQANRD